MKSVDDYLAENKKALEERQNIYNPINYLNCKNKVKRSLVAAIAEKILQLFDIEEIDK